MNENIGVVDSVSVAVERAASMNTVGIELNYVLLLVGIVFILFLFFKFLKRKNNKYNEIVGGNNGDNERGNVFEQG